MTSDPPARACENCGTEHEQVYDDCPNCGTGFFMPPVDEGRACEDCGESFADAEYDCPNCGSSLFSSA